MNFYVPIQCFCLYYLMENQKSSLNPLLAQTSRQFYSRRMPQRAPSNAQLDKVLTILNKEQEKRSFNRIKTEPKEQRAASPSGQADYLLKMARIRVENCLKRESSQWKQIYNSFDQFKRSGSIEIIKMNEANFLGKLQEVIKKNSGRVDDFALQKGRSQRKNQKGRLSIEQMNLIKQNKMLKQQLNNIVLKQQFPKTIDKRQQSIDLKHPSETQKKAVQKLEQLYHQIDILKQGNDLLRQEKRVLSEKIKQLRINNQNLCEEILRCRNNSSDYLQKCQMWKNIMAMQNQEIISLKRDIIDFKAEFTELNKKYRNTLKRISKMNSANPGKLQQITQKSVDVFSQQVEFFQKVRSIFVPKGYYNIMGKDQKDQKEPASATYKKYLSDKDALTNVEGIKKMNKFFYRFYRPSFFIFLQKYFEYQGVDKQNFQQININVGMHLLLTIRGIMDSKHNQYLISRYCHRAISSLSNFTVSWLCNFKIDAKTKKKTQITTDVCFQTIGAFYARLMSSQLNGYWEIITFREFLMETLTIDQLLFYLKARYKLMNGDCLDGSGTFVQVYQVNYIDALQLIQEIVGDFDYRKKLQQYIKRSVQFQRKKQIIDAHFVLRLLLQYYQYSKNKVFSTLSKTFSNYTRQKNTNMSFETYLKIYDYNFSQLSLIDRVQIYKKAYSLGRGMTNLDNIITVLNEEGYLVSEVQKMFKQKVIYEEKPEEIISTVQKPTQVQQFQQFYEKFIEKDCVSDLSKMGLQPIKRHLQLLDSPRSLNFDILFARMQFVFNFCMFRLRKLHDSKRLKDINIFSILPSHIQFYRTLLKSSIEKGALFQIHDQFKKKCAAKSILRFYRKKKGYLSRGYLSNSDYAEKPNKMQQIRKQFTNLIDNIKKKYTPGVLTQTITEYEENEEI